MSTTTLSCKYCGAELPADAGFCAECGRPRQDRAPSSLASQALSPLSATFVGAGLRPAAAPQVVYIQERRGGCLKWGMVGTGVLALGCVVLLVVGMLVGSRNDGDEVAVSRGPGAGSPAASGEERLASIGDTVTSDGLAITLNSASTTDRAGFAAADAGWTFAVLDVTIKNVSTEPQDFNFLYWSAKDLERGFTFDNEFLATTDQDLGSGKLGPGDLIRGNVVMKIRTDSPVVRFKYDTNPIGGKNLYWHVNQ